MRSVLSISGPYKKLQMIKKNAKKEGMTISAYVIHKIDADTEYAITEQELLTYREEARKDVKNGRAKKLHAAEDLLLAELP